MFDNNKTIKKIIIKKTMNKIHQTWQVPILNTHIMHMKFIIGSPHFASPHVSK
jgi:hypothetical protein